MLDSTLKVSLRRILREETLLLIVRTIQLRKLITSSLRSSYSTTLDKSKLDILQCSIATLHTLLANSLNYKAKLIEEQEKF